MKKEDNQTTHSVFQNSVGLMGLTTGMVASVVSGGTIPLIVGGSVGGAYLFTKGLGYAYNAYKNRNADADDLVLLHRRREPELFSYQKFLVNTARNNMVEGNRITSDLRYKALEMSPS
ncbi:MAG: hypothetical protein COC15_00335 [Legionellales bacterium]|nr:MAG: hypothetical protein COC15_00335 [Legionellales bacterium]